VTGPALSALRIVPDEQDQLPRLEQFRADHPEVVILLRGATPRAWIGRRKVERHPLRALLDELEQTIPPDASASRAGAPL
jgi:hypothetical protein